MTTPTQFILFHDNCMDGFISGKSAYKAAVYSAHKNIVVVPVNYGDTPVTATKGDVITMVDFCYPVDAIEDYLAAGVSVNVIDHHETSIDRIAASPLGKDAVFNDHYKVTTYGKCCEPNGNIFSNLLDPTTKRGNFFCVAADNRNLEPADKKAGAQLTHHYTYSGGAAFDKEEADYERELANEHDLWLHDGDPNHDAMQLSYWFKQWSDRNKYQRELMLRHPEESAIIMDGLIRSFDADDVAYKLLMGAALADEADRQISTICLGAKPVTFKIPGLDPDIKVGLIEEDLRDLGASLTGSKLVKHFGYDVALMRLKKKEKGTVYSMRSDQFGKNVNVAAIASAVFDARLAVSGGGHRNAAGMVIDDANQDQVFTIKK